MRSNPAVVVAKSVVLLALFTCSGGAVAAHPEEAQILDAYFNYVTGLGYRDAELAKANSVGNELETKVLEAGIARDRDKDRLAKALAKLQGAASASEPLKQDVKPGERKPPPRALIINVRVDGERAVATTNSGTPIELRKVTGGWKIDLARWGPDRPKEQQLKESQAASEVIRAVLAKVDAGEVKTADQLKALIKEKEAELKAKK
jgi:hypothetical protein